MKALGQLVDRRNLPGEYPIRSLDRSLGRSPFSPTAAASFFSITRDFFRYLMLDHVQEVPEPFGASPAKILDTEKVPGLVLAPVAEFFEITSGD